MYEIPEVQSVLCKSNRVWPKMYDKNNLILKIVHDKQYVYTLILLSMDA